MLNTQGRLRGEWQGAGGLKPKEAQYMLTQSIGPPGESGRGMTPTVLDPLSQQSTVG